MSLQQENHLQAIIAHAKEYGFIFPGSEIYDGLSAVYDYGPYGSELKKNIRDYWWKTMTQLHENIVGIDAAIFMHPTTWKASGHIDNFSDPMIDNLDSKKRYRVDHLIETHADKLATEGKKEEEFALLKNMDELLAREDYSSLEKLIEENNIVCEVSGTANWTDIRQFNLMFSTQLGSVTEETDTIYLRPETAQGIFVNFLNVQKTARMKIPFGIAQIGKAFRNEIVARQFIFRMREFEQMEMQFFCRPGTQKEWFEYWKEERMQWHLNLGISKEKYRWHVHSKPAHYADNAVDIEYDFPMGFKEVEGIHSRTDYDLRRHQEFSGKKLSYFDAEINQHYIPYVIETSIGLDRMCLLILCNSYEEEIIKKEDGTSDKRIVMRIPFQIAPIKLAILPLVKKDGLPEIARKIMDDCKQHFNCFYEEKDTIGKRYRRQDAIGTPFCITIDQQTKIDETVTIRYRDTMQQKRIPITEIKNIVKKSCLIH
ncbi:MAG: glycine--tRNA ligase [Chitinophagaceae bacterium]